MRVGEEEEEQEENAKVKIERGRERERQKDWEKFPPNFMGRTHHIIMCARSACRISIRSML